MGFVLVTAACGSDSSGTSSSGAAAPAGSGSATASSTSAERASFCDVLGSKSCASEEVQNCDENLVGANSAYVQALQQCMSAASSCTLQECTAKVLPEIAPGYPNVPVVTKCKDRNLACATKYAGDASDRKRTVDKRCESLVVLDAAGQARAADCETRECDAFASCLSEVAFDLD